MMLNKNLGSVIIQNENAYYYLNSLQLRVKRLSELAIEYEKINNYEVAMENIKPKIFWKDKPVYLKLLKRWHKQSILEALEYLGHTEEKLKKNSSLNSLTMVKNSILNICSNSWAYF